VTESPVAGNLRDEYNADLVVDVFYVVYDDGFQGALGIGSTPKVTPTRSTGYSSSAGSFIYVSFLLSSENTNTFVLHLVKFVNNASLNSLHFFSILSIVFRFLSFHQNSWTRSLLTKSVTTLERGTTDTFKVVA